jgi:nucleotide-binding universal stress UspA family protein
MRILYPTDFSDTSLNAFRYALNLARLTNGSIVTFHAYELPNTRHGGLARTISEVYATISLEEFEDYKDAVPLLRKVAEETGAEGVPMTHVMQQGDPKLGIINTAKANQSELIVMGSTGAGMMKKLFVGSVAAYVMEEAGIPVIVVPSEATQTRPVSTIAYATELTGEDEKALLKLRPIANALGASIRCVHVDVAHTSAVGTKDEAFRQKYPDLPLHILDGTDVESSIKAFIENQEIDMLSTVIHKRNRIQELFEYSLTKKLASHLDVPVLVFPAPVA